MSNIRLFYPESLSINLESSLEKPQSHYLTKVMRIKKGKSFSLFNKNGEWEASIIEISKGKVFFKVDKQIRQLENEKQVWLAFSPIKSNYFNFMIQKATELGVTKFLPLIMDRSVVRKINHERLQKIIIEASEQSNRINIPYLEKIKTLENFLKDGNLFNLIVGDLNSDNKKINLDKNKPTCLLIGPEGDFSEKERLKILDFKGIQAIKLSDNVLRTETAVISGLSIINYLNN
mgnify:CR=1 FL=1